MRMLNLFLRYLWGPINLVLLRRALRSYGYQIIKIGESTFHGPAEFLRVCEEAMAELSRVDLEMYRGLTAAYRYTFWYGEHRHVEDLITGVYSINDAFLRWGTLGVTTRLVEAYHSTVLTKRKLRNLFHISDAIKKADQMKDFTRTWLVSHHYPHELVECYE